MIDELITHARGTIVLGDVQSIDDTGEAQTISVQTHDGVLRSGVEVASIHGLASNPGDGAACILLAIGGDQAHLVALPLMGFGTRFGNLPKGGVALYDDAGNYLKFTADGDATLAAAALLRLAVQTLSIVHRCRHLRGWRQLPVRRNNPGCAARRRRDHRRELQRALLTDTVTPRGEHTPRARAMVPACCSTSPLPGIPRVVAATSATMAAWRSTPRR
jgi:hypothetical protein